MNAVLEKSVGATALKQHLIDPEICIRCNTCEVTCPVNAITHDDVNYVVNADICNACMACISPCPTGSIDNWRIVPRSAAYSTEEQLTWNELPAELTEDQLAAAGVADGAVDDLPAVVMQSDVEAVNTVEAPFSSAAYGATVPPWSAAHPYANLYGPRNPTTATVVGNFQLH